MNQDAKIQVLNTFENTKKEAAQMLGLIVAGLGEDGYVIRCDNVFWNMGLPATPASVKSAKLYQQEDAKAFARQLRNGNGTQAEAVSIRQALVDIIKYMQEQIDAVNAL